MQLLTGREAPPAHQAVLARLEAALPTWREERVRMIDLAQVAGVSPRTVYRVFASHRGASPIAHLRGERLEEVRRRLLTPGPGETVTSVALDHGFSHLGRFAAFYERHFGERPSATLRRGRQAAGRGQRRPPRPVRAAALGLDAF